MAAITHIGHDELGFAKAPLASAKLILFVALLPVLLFGVPLAIAAGLYALLV
jgi:hypothetical protein